MSLAPGGDFPDESPVQEQVTTSCDQARITVILGPAPATPQNCKADATGRQLCRLLPRTELNPTH